MPEPSDVSSLRSFLGSVQFYGKFIPKLSSITAPLHQLTKKNTPWSWDRKAKDAFDNLKTILSNDTVLAHYDPSQQIGISYYASASGTVAVLFHRSYQQCFKNIDRCPETLQSNPKDALAVMFALKKFHQ